jgi:hypothetical protein
MLRAHVPGQSNATILFVFSFALFTLWINAQLHINLSNNWLGTNAAISAQRNQIQLIMFARMYNTKFGA